MKLLTSILLSLTALTSAFAQETYDPIGLLKPMEHQPEVWQLIEMAPTQWNTVFNTYIDQDKARFFQITDHVCFIDYLSESYREMNDKARVAQAEKIANEAIQFAAFYPDEYRSKDNPYIQALIIEVKDFYTVRFCPDELKVPLYQAWRKLKSIVQ